MNWRETDNPSGNPFLIVKKILTKSPLSPNVFSEQVLDTENTRPENLNLREGVIDPEQNILTSIQLMKPTQKIQ